MSTEPTRTAKTIRDEIQQLVSEAAGIKARMLKITETARDESWTAEQHEVARRSMNQRMAEIRTRTQELFEELKRLEPGG